MTNTWHRANTVDLLPHDEFNSALLANVHPADWKNPTPDGRYHLVVIGAGTAGLVTAAGAAGLGAKVALVERNLMGGDCLNTGCVPSKALLKSAKLVHQARNSSRYGIRQAAVDFDFADVMERVQRVIRTIEPHDSAERYTGLGVECLQGEARIVSPWEVDVNGTDGRTQRLTTRAIVIAAGGGGPPVYRHPLLGIEGVDAVVDKDRVAAIVAAELGAEVLMILTDVDAVYEGWGTPDARPLRRLSLDEVERLIRSGGVDEGGMKPKIEAAAGFVRGGGQRAVIARLIDGPAALRGEAGTTLVRSA